MGDAGVPGGNAEDTSRRAVQARRLADLRDPQPDYPRPTTDDVIPQPQPGTPGYKEPDDNSPVPAAQHYVVSLDTIEQGILVTILVPWPAVTFGPEANGPEA
jgi:hypothetical protein